MANGGGYRMFRAVTRIRSAFPRRVVNGTFLRKTFDRSWLLSRFADQQDQLETRSLDRFCDVFYCGCLIAFSAVASNALGITSISSECTGVDATSALCTPFAPSTVCHPPRAPTFTCNLSGSVWGKHLAYMGNRPPGGHGAMDLPLRTWYGRGYSSRAVRKHLVTI